jgi:di/tricarboxylate transporter
MLLEKNFGFQESGSRRTEPPDGPPQVLVKAEEHNSEEAPRMGPDGWIVLSILGAAIAAFASNRLRVDAVGLGVLLTLAISGILTTREAVAGFSDTSVLMIGGLFIVGEGLVTTGVAAAAGVWLGRIGRGSETRLIALLMLVVASLGAFMSSTGIVASSSR